MAKTKTLDTIWEVDDALWSIVEPILNSFWPRKRTGRPTACWRRALNGIVYQLRTGCQWNKLPAEFGDDSTVHRWFQRWSEEGVLERIWAVLIENCDELRGVEWKWQAADGSLAKGACSFFCVRVAGNVICSSRAAGGPRTEWRSD